jgi:hypothetical protein
MWFVIRASSYFEAASEIGKTPHIPKSSAGAIPQTRGAHISRFFRPNNFRELKTGSNIL